MSAEADLNRLAFETGEATFAKRIADRVLAFVHPGPETPAQRDAHMKQAFIRGNDAIDVSDLMRPPRPSADPFDTGDWWRQ